MDEFSKFAGYKISIQKSVAFLYISSDFPEKDIRNLMKKNKVLRSKFNQGGERSVY
jgi:hypothetical protein